MVKGSQKTTKTEFYSVKDIHRKMKGLGYLPVEMEGSTNLREGQSFHLYRPEKEDDRDFCIAIMVRFNQNVERGIIGFRPMFLFKPYTRNAMCPAPERFAFQYKYNERIIIDFDTNFSKVKRNIEILEKDIEEKLMINSIPENKLRKIGLNILAARFSDLKRKTAYEVLFDKSDGMQVFVENKLHQKYREEKGLKDMSEFYGSTWSVIKSIALNVMAKIGNEPFTVIIKKPHVASLDEKVNKDPLESFDRRVRVFGELAELLDTVYFEMSDIEEKKVEEFEFN